MDTKFSFRISSIKVRVSNEWKSMDINLSCLLSSGQVLVLVGKSGSGKSLCSQYIAGVTPDRDYSSASIEYLNHQRQLVRDGEQVDLESKSPECIQIVPQGLERFFVAPTVAEEIEFSLDTAGIAHSQKARQRRDILRDLALTRHTHSPISTLSAGEKELVAIGSAISRSPAVLILDEPDHFLTVDYRNLCLSMLKKYTDTDGILIVASHNPEIYKELSPKILNISTSSHQQATNPTVKFQNSGPGAQSIVLKISGGDILKSGERFTVLFSFDEFSIYRSQIILLSGPNGSGKTSFLRDICGFRGAFPEGMELNDRKVSKRNPPLFPDEIGYVSYEPVSQMFRSTPLELILLTKDRSKHHSHDENNASLDILDDFGIPKNKKIADMSFGERQLTALTSFMNYPSVLLVDEPPYSCDSSQMECILKLLKLYQNKGCGIVLSTHYPSFYESICDKHYEICNNWLRIR